VHVAALFVGVLQTLLVEVAANAGFEAAAILAKLVDAMRGAESLEANIPAAQPGSAIRRHAHLGAGGRMPDQIFLGVAIRAVAGADVFPVGVQAFALRKAGAAAEGGEQRQCRKNPEE
jgi:hypothetical protein